MRIETVSERGNMAVPRESLNKAHCRGYIE